MTIVAAADGSALGNPGPAGWAWYVSDECWAAGGWPRATNNQGELQAVIDLLEQTEAAGLAGEQLRVLCDSQYVINTVTKWMPGWKRKGWRKADGKPVMNLEFVQRLDELLRERPVVFEWVKGHAGHDLNEAADVRARGAATAYQNRTAVPSGPGWNGASVDRAGAPDAASTDRVVAVPVAARTITDPVRAGEVTPSLFDGLELDEDELDIVVRLEKELLSTRVRADASAVARLLHPEFEEIGASGRQWDRDAIIQSLAGDPDGARYLRTIGVSTVAPGAVLLSYEAEGARGVVLRSSLWLKDASGAWRLRFHQGTPLG